MHADVPPHAQRAWATWREASRDPQMDSNKWFCRLDLTNPIPDHSTFSKNRHGRFRDSHLFRHPFEQVLARCIAEGLVGSDSFGVDASLISADACRFEKVDAQGWAPEKIERDHRERRLRRLRLRAETGRDALRPPEVSIGVGN